MKGLPGNWEPDLLAAVQDETVGGEPLCPVLIMHPKHQCKAAELFAFIITIIIIIIVITITNCN
jgi:hypothetical protein